jgi:DNA-binding response OmpR family regulator
MTDQRATSPDLGYRPSVMIVDDDAEMRALLRDALERDGFDVREDPGDRLVPLIEGRAPDAIVLDKEMAGVNGLDLLSYIRQRHPVLPVIVVTAFGGTEVEAEALRRGATYYIDKPFRVARLLAMLRAALSQAAQGTRRRWAEYG